MSHWKTRIVSQVRNPGFWLIVALLVLIAIPYYDETLSHPPWLNQIMAAFNLERQSFERILFLVPIIWSGFIVGWRGAFATSLASLALMLPRAFHASPISSDAIFETAAVFIIGNVLSISFESLRKARQQRTELEIAHRELQSHTKLIEQNERRLAALNQIASTVSQTLELNQILNSALSTVSEMMQLSAAWIFLLQQDAPELLLAAYRGVSDDFVKQAHSIKVGEGFCGAVARSGEPLFVGNIAADPRLSLAVPLPGGTQSVLLVPLSSKGKVNGVLGIIAPGGRSFQQEEIELLTAIGNQIGVAVENARLYRNEQEAVEELRASETRFRELFENAHDAIWLHNLEGAIITANKAAEKLTGYSRDELLKMNVKRFLLPESLDIAGEVRGRFLANEPVSQPYQQRMIRKDGSQAFIQLTTSLVYSNNKLVAFQHIARDVTEEKRLQENLRFYLHQATRAQEEERKRISRELHDETIQALVVLTRKLDTMSTEANGLTEQTRQRLEDLREQTTNIVRGVRRLSQDLRPAALDRLGLLSALEWLAADVSQYSGIATRLNVTGAERRLPEEIELVLFRITQEALRNVWRHSGATQADILVEYNENMTRISVSDNGKGFDVPSSIGDLAREGKLGLAGMQERASLIGGSLTAHSEPGKGATISVELPA